LERGDLALIRVAIKSGWPMSRAVRRRIVAAVGEALDDARPRLRISAVRLLIEYGDRTR
jgi:phage baseplate assembly protein W